MSSIENRLRNNNASGFTLIELLLVIAIVALLASLLYPSLEKARVQSQSVVCANNLSQIGVAVLLKLQDNNNRFPMIENDPDNPTYAPEDQAVSLAEALKPYGVAEKGLRCPADVRKDNYYGKRGSSYWWWPFLDDEVQISPKIYTQQGTLEAPVTLVPICSDYESVHRGKKNVLYGDGHVKMN